MPLEMVDYVGKPLEVGDRVVYPKMFGSNMVKFTVEVYGFTDTKVKITPISVKDENRGYSLCSPDSLIIYEKVKR